MRFYNSLHEGKKLDNPMIGLGINPSDIRDVTKYVKSWLIRYDIPFEEVTDYHLTISQILGRYDKDELARAVHDIETDYTMNPVGLKILRGKRVPKDFIVIEYSPSNQFVQSVKDISSEFKTFQFAKGVTPHVSLFMVKQGEIDDRMMKEISGSAPTLKRVKPIDVQLWNARHEKEYEV